MLQSIPTPQIQNERKFRNVNAVDKRNQDMEIAVAWLMRYSLRCNISISGCEQLTTLFLLDRQFQNKHFLNELIKRINIAEELNSDKFQSENSHNEKFST